MENEQIDLEIRNKLVRARLRNLDNPLTTEELETQRKNIVNRVKRKYGEVKKYKRKREAMMSRQTTTPEGDKKQAARPSASLSVPPAPPTTPFSTASNVQAAMTPFSTASNVQAAMTPFSTASNVQADVDPSTKFLFAQLDAAQSAQDVINQQLQSAQDVINQQLQSAQDVINQQRFGLIRTLTPVRGGVQVPHTPTTATLASAEAPTTAFPSAPTFTPQRPSGVAAASSARGFHIDSSPAPSKPTQFTFMAPPIPAAGGFRFDSSPAPSKPTQFTFMAPPIPAGGFHFDSSSSMDEDELSELSELSEL
jgi:hypothetical protein